MEPTPVTIPDLNHKADVLDGQSRDNKNEYFRNLQDNLKGKKRKNWNNWLTSDEINESKLYKAYQDYLEKHPPDDVDSLADAGSGSEPESDQGSGRLRSEPKSKPKSESKSKAKSDSKSEPKVELSQYERGLMAQIQQAIEEEHPERVSEALGRAGVRQAELKKFYKQTFHMSIDEAIDAMKKHQLAALETNVTEIPNQPDKKLVDKLEARLRAAIEVGPKTAIDKELLKKVKAAPSKTRDAFFQALADVRVKNREHVMSYLGQKQNKALAAEYDKWVKDGKKEGLKRSRPDGSSDAGAKDRSPSGGKDRPTGSFMSAKEAEALRTKGKFETFKVRNEPHLNVREVSLKTNITPPIVQAFHDSTYENRSRTELAKLFKVIVQYDDKQIRTMTTDRGGKTYVQLRNGLVEYIDRHAPKKKSTKFYTQVKANQKKASK